MAVQLISENYIKSVSIVGDNVDSKFISPAITKATDMGLEPLIGSALLEKLNLLVQSDPNTDPTNSINDPINKNYKFLLDVYVTPYLLQKVQAELVLNMFAKIRNQGLVQYNDISTNQITTKDAQWMMTNFQNDANFYAKRMTDYLCANTSLFPEYHQFNPKNNDMRANSNAKTLCEIVL